MPLPECKAARQGLFGRHAAGAIRWLGGRGGGRAPPGHRPGWKHPKCGLLRGRYGGASEKVRVRVSVVCVFRGNIKHRTSTDPRVRWRSRRSRLLRFRACAEDESEKKEESKSQTYKRIQETCIYVAILNSHYHRGTLAHIIDIKYQ